MNEIVAFCLNHPILVCVVVVAVFMLNSAAMAWVGIWVGFKSRSFATKEELNSKIEKVKQENSDVHDDMAHRYQRTMEETATKMRDILKDKGDLIGRHLRGAASEIDVVKKHAEKTGADVEKIKTALAIVFPQTKDIFQKGA